MKILIYGAGVIGSIFAYMLKSGGNEITVLARGERLKQLRNNGIIIHDELFKKQYHTEIDVTELLSPEDYYDIVFIIMPRHQTSDILPILAKNTKIPSYLFVGNNVTGAKEYSQALGKNRILLGFGGSGGYRKDGKVISAYVEDCILYVGEIDGQISKRVQKIKKVLEESKIKVETPKSIDAWLKTHAALISALALGSKAARNKSSILGNEDQLIKKSILAFQENLKALKELKIPILPSKYKYLKNFPKKLIARKIKNLINSDFGRIVLSGHANSAQEEMKRIIDDFNQLVKDVKSSRTVNKELYSLCYK